MSAPSTTSDNQPGTNNKGVSILARSLFRNMSDQGFSTDQIIGLSTELIQLVQEDLRRGSGSELAAE